MSVSSTQIGNRALQLIGSKRAASFFPPEATKGARAVNAAYDMVRQRCLVEYNWGFATGWHQVSADGTNPDTDPDYGYRFQIPVGVLKVIVVKSTGGGLIKDWTQNGRYIHSNESGPLFIRGLEDVEDTTLFHPLFVSYLALSLAMDIVEEITQSGTKQDRIIARLENREEKLAVQLEAEIGVPEDLEVDSYIAARA